MPPCAPHAECAPQKDRPCRRSRCVHRKQPAPRIRPRYPATPTSPWIHPPSAMSTKDIRSKDRRNRRPPTALPRDNAPDHSRSRRSVRRRIVAYPSSVYPRKLDAGEFSEDSERALPIHPLSHTESHPSPASTHCHPERSEGPVQFDGGLNDADKSLGPSARKHRELRMTRVCLSL